MNTKHVEVNYFDESFSDWVPLDWVVLFITTSSDGCVFMYDVEPVLHNDRWRCEGSHTIRFLGELNKVIDWKKSLRRIKL